MIKDYGDTLHTVGES